MRDMMVRMTLKYPNYHIYYNLPPEKDSPFRKGESKAGNLNSALELLQRIDTDIKYVETRDADDLVVDPYFLRHTIGQMEVNEKIAYVQTIKEVKPSKGDPFGYMEKLFYNSLMLSKNAANAVFPCGSGLVWRKYALLDIGGFPGWNLVEDFQSGAEALKRKWKSMFVPIVGALGQIAPEDIPNLFKQRGTWALDSFRLLFWWDKKGLSFRQKLHFAESGLFYIMSILFFIQGLIPVIKLIWGIDPIGGDELGYFVHITPYVLSVYLFILSLVRYRPISFIEIFRSFQIAFGLAPIYVKAFFMALFNGRYHKPKYVVTRKNHHYGLYITKVIPQTIFFLIILGSIVYEVYYSESMFDIDIITTGWAVFYLIILSQVIKDSWFKVFSKH
jgi:cellulose synthase (UDP-forming)